MIAVSQFENQTRHPVGGLLNPASRGRNHPTGRSSQMLPPITSIIPAQEFMRQTLHNASVFMFESVQPSTRGSYWTGWNHWRKWVPLVGTNTSMSVIPPGFHSDKENTYSLPESCVLSFLAHLKINVGVSGKTASNYLSGVRFMLFNSNVDVSFIDRSNAIKATRAGMVLMHRAESRESETNRHPLTCEMIVYAKDILYNAPDVFTSRAIGMALLIGFCCLARVSEYLRTKGKHFFRSEDVIFTLKPLNEGGAPRYITSTDAHMYANDEVTGVVFTLQDAKNDSDGRGYTIPFDRNRSPDAAFDFVGECFDFAIFARPKRGSPFISSSAGEELSYDRLLEAIKNIARHFGLDPARYGTHSSRIGGASALSAAGVEDSVIKLMGRWQSIAFLKYIRLATSIYSRALEALTNSSVFTVDHMRRCVSGVNIAMMKVARR